MPWSETHIFGKGLVQASQNRPFWNPTFPSWVRRPASRQGSLGTFPYYGYDPFCAGIEIFLYKPCMGNTLGMQKRNLFYQKMDFIYCGYCKYWPQKSIKQNFGISLFEDHFVTNIGGALQHLFYEIFWVCLWKSWENAILIKSAKYDAFSEILVSKGSPNFNKQPNILSFIK